MSGVVWHEDGSVTFPLTLTAEQYDTAVNWQRIGTDYGPVSPTVAVLQQLPERPWVPRVGDEVTWGEGYWPATVLGIDGTEAFVLHNGDAHRFVYVSQLRPWSDR